jgi:hypothetical protein
MPAIEAESLAGETSLGLWNSTTLSRAFPTTHKHPEPLAIRLSVAARSIQDSWQKAERFVFAGMWLTIACVSAFDSYLTVRYCDELYFQEINPIARFLLDINNWEPSLLIGWKFLGTILVLGIVAVLYTHHRRIGLAVTGALASLQLVLLGILTMG